VVQTWIERGAVTSGPLFRAINRHGQVQAGRLSGIDVARVLKKVTLRAGLDAGKWRTHEAVNQGVRTFGNWLLTLRGGISHGLASEPVKTRKGDRLPTDAERRDRRLLLALSWLSVESEDGVPVRYGVNQVD